MYSLNNYKVELLKDSIFKKKMSDEEYFSNKYSKFISNSRLKLINPMEGGSPQKYLEGERVSTSSLEFGSAVHALILQPDEFELPYYEHKPSGKLGKFIEELVKYRKAGLNTIDALNKASVAADYYKDKLTYKIIRKAIIQGWAYYKDLYHNNFNKYEKTPIILNPQQYQNVITCLDRFNRSSLYQFLNKQNITKTKENYNEEAIFAHFKITLPTQEVVTLPFKAKLDNYSIDPDFDTVILNDIKTTSNEVDWFMGQPSIEEEDKWLFGSFQKYHYYRQIAIYMLILQKLLNNPKYTYQANILTIESFGEFNSKIHPISNAYIKLGLAEFKELICRVAYHTQYGFDQPFNKYE